MKEKNREQEREFKDLNTKLDRIKDERIRLLEFHDTLKVILETLDSRAKSTLTAFNQVFIPFL